MLIRTGEIKTMNCEQHLPPCLEIKHLTKQYHAAQKPAVDDLNVVCYPGEIVINGFDIAKEPVKAKRTFGYVSDKHDVFVKLTGIQYVDFMANAYGVSVADRKARLAELEDVFQLGDRIFDTINDYSHGMRQKICMMGSLIHNPKLWIMDEPMIGLDPLTSQRVSEFMKEYAKQGNCILFSSHNINSVQKLCDRAVIIQNGVKTDDFYFEQFECEHPDIDLEEYFLSRTAKAAK